jgi:hypothetical protein
VVLWLFVLGHIEVACTPYGLTVARVREVESHNAV